MTRRTRAEIVPVDGIVKESLDLFNLMDEFYTGMTHETFDTDLKEKDSLILLRERECGRIVGFTTLMTRKIELNAKKYLVFYSGDTIVRPQYWGSPELLKVWIHHVFATARQSPGHEPYWMLISSGYRTYRFLSVFFSEFYPRFDESTPINTKQMMDHFAARKYGRAYLPERGIVRFANPTPLRPEIGTVQEARRADPHIEFFHRANLRWHAGDELVCLTPATPNNLTRAGRRIIGAPSIS
jgi:hypothetical protein